MEALRQRLESLLVSGRRRYAPDAGVSGTIERLQQGDRYYWDGLRRAGDPARPYVVFQVTLSGQGVYEVGGIKHLLPPGTGFAAVVPSAHRYYMPPDTPEWCFFWLIFRHPYVVARIAEQQRTRGGQGGGAVLHLTPDCALLQQAVSLLTEPFADRFDEELALFTFLVEFERHLNTAERPALPAGEELREAVRQFMRERLARPVDVSEIAAAHRMSRSRFSHHFKAMTGEAPGHYMTRVRLEEAARLLTETDATLAAIATETGFADANHLCKVFRRHYHLSPGMFRRQMR